MALGPCVDGYLFVVREGSTHRKELTRALELIEQVDAPLLGLVLNATKQSANQGYYVSYPTATSRSVGRRKP
jgi:Mrp family chromosome partitioning ATPase